MNCIPRSSPGAVLFIIQMWVIAGLLPREGWESNSPFGGRNSNTLTKKTFGYPTFGYWKWFEGEDAAEIIEQNVS